MPRDPRQIQLEIDAARESLAATLDQLAYRSNPQRLKAEGQAAAQRFLQTPAGKATVAALGLLVTLVVVQKVRHRNDYRVVEVPVPVVPARAVRSSGRTTVAKTRSV